MNETVKRYENVAEDLKAYYRAIRTRKRARDKTSDDEDYITPIATPLLQLVFTGEARMQATM